MATWATNRSLATDSGTNTGDVTLAAVGSTPSANGASLSGQALTLQPADATNPGVLTATTQTIAGAKTFTGITTLQNRLDLASTNGTAHHRLQYVASSTSSVLTLTDTSGTAMMSWDTSGDVEMGGGIVRLFFGAGTMANGGPYIGPSTTAVLLAGGATASGTNVISNAQVAVTTGKIHSFQSAGSEKLAVDGAGKLITSTGAAGTSGSATLSSGTVTVSTTAVKTGDKIFLQLNAPGGTLGAHYKAGTITDSTSFVITSVTTAGATVATDTSTLFWWIAS